MFGIATSTAQESMLGSLLTAQVYAGVSLLRAQLTKCDGVFSYPNGLVFWNGGSPQHVPSSRKRRGNLFQEKLPNFSFRDPNTCYPVKGGRGTLKQLICSKTANGELAHMVK